MSPHTEIGGTANTIQFPHRLLNGFGIALPTEYGPKHNAIHIHNVSVGAKYTLNCDTSPWNIAPAPAGMIGQIGGVHDVGNANTGNHFPKV